MQLEVKTDPVALTTGGSAVAAEQKDIEAHFLFSVCLDIFFYLSLAKQINGQ